MTRTHLIKIAEKYPSVSIDQRILGGMPAIQGTRIPISLILASFRDGIKMEDICLDYFLTPTQVRQAMDYVIQILDDPFIVEDD